MDIALLQEEPDLSRRTARVCVAARVLARHIDELATPIAARLLEEMGESADLLSRALPVTGTAGTDGRGDLDEILEIRCICL